VFVHTRALRRRRGPPSSLDARDRQRPRSTRRHPDSIRPRIGYGGDRQPRAEPRLERNARGIAGGAREDLDRDWFGNPCSQIWANLVLTSIDHLLGSHLGLPRFVRYCDDVLVFDDPEGLRAAWNAVARRRETLRLRLHATKCRLHRTSDRIAFLAFVLQLRVDAVRVALRTRNGQRFRRRMKVLRALYAGGAVDLDEITSRIRAWLAHARHLVSPSLVAHDRHGQGFKSQVSRDTGGFVEPRPSGVGAHGVLAQRSPTLK
jgi:hypothetical protein